MARSTHRTGALILIAVSPAGVARFRSWLDELGVNATVRRNRGTSIDAACGQLAARVELRTS